MEAREQGKEIAKTICNHLNPMTAEQDWVEGFVEGLMCQHRTLQQSAVRAILNAFQKYGKECAERHRFDLRNQAAVEECQKLNTGGIPFI